MAEFRYECKSINGKRMQGIVVAPTRIEAQRRVQRIARQHQARVQTIRKRVLFQYKIRSFENQKTFEGQISAFSSDEVRGSLKKMGYEVLAIRRNYFHSPTRVPEKDIVLFLRLCADLLREKYTYDEILNMISSGIENRTLRDTIMVIKRDHKAGKDGRQVYMKHAPVLGRFISYMLMTAANSNNMAEIYEHTARFTERSADFRKNLRSVLFMPSFILVASVLALIFYVVYIFPQIAGMLHDYQVQMPPMTAATLAVQNFIETHFWSLLGLTLAPAAGMLMYARTEGGKVQYSRWLLKIPVVGPLFHRISVEIFARVFYTLYDTAGSNIAAIKMASEACRNRYIEKQIKEKVVPLMLRTGSSFSEALSRSGAFPGNAVYALKSGEDAGLLRDAAFRLANFYEKETAHKMVRLVDVINLSVSIIISLLIILISLISSEIGFISPPVSPLAR